MLVTELCHEEEHCWIPLQLIFANPLHLKCFWTIPAANSVGQGEANSVGQGEANSVGQGEANSVG